MSLNLNASPHLNDTSISMDQIIFEVFTEIQNLALNRIFVISSHPVLDLVLFKLFFLFSKNIWSCIGMNAKILQNIMCKTGVYDFKVQLMWVLF